MTKRGRDFANKYGRGTKAQVGGSDDDREKSSCPSKKIAAD